METKDLDNLNRDELFEVLKGKCKSKSRANVVVGLALLILIIVAILYRKNYPFQYRQGIAYISFFIELALIGCACALWVLNNYCFLKKTDGLDSPDKLVYRYEKRIRNDRKIFFLCLLAYWLDLNLILLEPLWVALTVFIVSSVVFSLIYFKSDSSLWNSRNKILEQLQELIDMK